MNKQPLSFLGSDGELRLLPPYGLMCIELVNGGIYIHSTMGVFTIQTASPRSLVRDMFAGINTFTDVVLRNTTLKIKGIYVPDRNPVPKGVLAIESKEKQYFHYYKSLAYIGIYKNTTIIAFANCSYSMILADADKTKAIILSGKDVRLYSMHPSHVLFSGIEDEKHIMTQVLRTEGYLDAGSGVNLLADYRKTSDFHNIQASIAINKANMVHQEGYSDSR